MWSSQYYIEEGKKLGRSDDLLRDSANEIEDFLHKNPKLPPILTLNHLATRANAEYAFLRKVVERNIPDTYRKFSIKKRSGGRRYIRVPSPQLMRLQRWINEYILQAVPAHSSSHAFGKGCSITKCASVHCKAKWLIKLDITNFFESISEIQVYRAFIALGYAPLVSFELARLCTVSTESMLSPRLYLKQWRTNNQNTVIKKYRQKTLGYLPQGAPTSPVLANLVMRDIDQALYAIAKGKNLKYSRYSDDITFSSYEDNFQRKDAIKIVRETTEILAKYGLQSNSIKTKIIPPGSKKIILGLLVDNSTPRLQRKFKDRIKQHLYYLEKYGVIFHANKRGFDSIFGMKCHIRGLIDFASMIEPKFSEECLYRFHKIAWPQ